MRESVASVPESMRAELAEWNSGRGIDLETWVGCTGNFALAVGYAAVFWPKLVEYEGYVLHQGFSLESLRSFEERGGSDRCGIEAVMNHRHIRDLQYVGCPDTSLDKLELLGETMKEIYEAKLKVQFPDRKFSVAFFRPENPEDLSSYEVSFWQLEELRNET